MSASAEQHPPFEELELEDRVRELIDEGAAHSLKAAARQLVDLALRLAD